MICIWNSERNLSFNEDIWIGFYGGEPLLNFKLIEKIVDYLRSVKLKFNKFRFNMTTNGTLLDKYMDFLVESDFNLLISLDGNRRGDSYRVFHNGRESFDVVVRNVKKLRKQYPEFYENNVNFNSVLHDRNSVEEIFGFIKSEFEKVPRISELDQTGVRDCEVNCFKNIFQSIKKSFENVTNKTELERELLFNSPIGNRLIKHLIYNSKYFYKNFADLTIEKSDVFPTGSCIPLQKKIFLDTDGYIYPCERVGKEHKMGIVTEEGVDIWFDEIEAKYNIYFEKLKEQCKTCFNKKTCPNCILKMEPDKNGFKCKYWLGKSEFEKKVEEILDFLRDNRDLYKKIAEDVFLG